MPTHRDCLPAIRRLRVAGCSSSWASRRRPRDRVGKERDFAPIVTRPANTCRPIWNRKPGGLALPRTRAAHIPLTRPADNHHRGRASLSYSIRLFQAGTRRSADSPGASKTVRLPRAGRPLESGRAPAAAGPPEPADGPGRSVQCLDPDRDGDLLFSDPLTFASVHVPSTSRSRTLTHVRLRAGQPPGASRQRVWVARTM